MADLMRRQMRSVGPQQALSPIMDVARDARWGRVHETYGEDPYLVTAMSVAFTRGIQGNDLRQGVLASAKHFLGYTGLAGDFVIEPGPVEVSAGSSSSDIRSSAKFTVTGKTRTIRGEDRAFFSVATVGS